MYGKDLKQIHLAPAYDIVSTSIYEQSTRNMAFRIGDTASLDEITRSSFQEAAREAGLGVTLAMRRFDRMAGRFRNALRESAEELVRGGYPKAEEIEKKILQTAGVKSLL